MNQKCLTLLFAVVMGASGCSTLITQSPAFIIHDLGAAPRVDLAPEAAPAVIEVLAPSWLSTSAMQYRLDYVGPGGRESYGENRWAGHPSEMLAHWLMASLTPEAPGASRCRLTLELDEFVQRFLSADESVAEATLRARFSGPRDESALARRSFGYSVPAPTADAHGGVLAHRKGAAALLVAIADWLEGLGGEGDRGILDRCRR